MTPAGQILRDLPSDDEIGQLTAEARKPVLCVGCDSPLLPKNWQERERLILQRGRCDNCFAEQIRCKYLPAGNDLFCVGGHHVRVRPDGMTLIIPSADHQIQQQYAHESFETFDPTGNRHAFQKCLDFADAKGWETGPLMITGQTGTGKTHLLNAIRHVARTKHQSTEMVLAATMAKTFQEANRDGQEGAIAQDRIHTWKSCDILFIDDLGNEHSPTPYFPKSLLQLLSERISRNVGAVRVVCASSLHPKLLQSRYGELGPQIMSRLLGAQEAVTTSGADKRKGK